MFEKLQLQNHVDGVSFSQPFQKVENGVHVGKQVASEWQASGCFHHFLQYCLSSIYCQKRMGECCDEWHARGKPVARGWQAGGMLVASKWQASGKHVASDRQASGT